MRTTKFYVIGILFLLQTQSLFGQTEKKVSLGLTFTPSVSWLAPTNSGYSSDGSKLGFKYGLLMDFRLFGVDNYSLASGFTMNHIGGELIEPSTFTNSNGDVIAATSASNYKLTYVDIPMVIRLKTKEIGYMVYYGTFGTEFGFNVSATNDYSLSYSNSSTTETQEDVSNRINLFRSSLVFGIGVERNISGNTNYRIGLTYHNGLTNIMDSNAYVVDGSGNTLIQNGKPVEDKQLSTKLKFIELNLAVVF